MKVEKIRDVAVKIDCDISKLTEQDYQDINEIYLDKLIIDKKNTKNLKREIKLYLIIN